MKKVGKVINDSTKNSEYSRQEEEKLADVAVKVA